MKQNYQMFRVNFVVFWIISNLGFILVVEKITNGNTKDVVNDGSIGTLEVFALYLAFMVVYKVIFGGLHILRFKKRNFDKKYKIKIYTKDEIGMREAKDKSQRLLDSKYIEEEDE
jgi:hypothetical protein